MTGSFLEADAGIAQKMFVAPRGLITNFFHGHGQKSFPRTCCAFFVPRFQQILIARAEAECEAELLYFTGAQVAGQAVAGRSWLPFHTV